MTPQRINELLDTCGTAWLGGQRELVRTAMAIAVAEEAHTVSIKFLRPTRCTCDVCARVNLEIEAERLALGGKI